MSPQLVIRESRWSLRLWSQPNQVAVWIRELYDERYAKLMQQPPLHIRPSKVEERRASRRYKLGLQVEIRIESDIKEFELILGRTRDISAHGFYFRIGQSLSVGMKIGFSIMPPWEVTQATHAFINGRARVVRVEEASDNSIDHLGVGAVIESYKFGQAESSAC
jgi:hypothetical protein